MQELLPFLIGGLVTGSVYGTAGLGLLLTYRTTGIFNLAHGSVAAVAAYLFYELTATQGMPWWLAAALCILVLGPVSGLVFELLARSLHGRSLVFKIACTVGVIEVVQSVISLKYAAGTVLVVNQYLPSGSFTVDDTPVTYAQLIVVLVGLAAAVGLWLFFARTRAGVAMRAAVENPALLEAAGTDVRRVRRGAWAIGSSFACASGVLLAPLLAQLDVMNLTFLVVTAFGAAALGAFTNLPMTYVGGVAIGIAQQLCGKYFTTGFLTNLPPALPFLVLFAVLLAFPKRWVGEEPLVVRMRSSLPWRLPARGSAAAAAAVLVVLVLVPQFDELHITDWTNALSMVILFLSLGLLVRTSGQVSLAHVTFMAIGVCTMSHLTVDHHLPWLLALLLSGLIAVPIGAVLAIPAIRLSGLYLALATLGFGITVQYLFFTEPYMFGSNGLGLNVPRPDWHWLSVGSDNGFYYLMLVAAVLVTLFVLTISRSRLGRLLSGLSDSPAGLVTSGVSVNVTRTLVFCISAFLAAVAGALQGASAGAVTGGAYQTLQSLTFFVLIVICVGSVPVAAVSAAFLLVVVPILPGLGSSDTTSWLSLLFGLAAALCGVTDALRQRFVQSRGPAVDPIAPDTAAEPQQVRPLSKSTVQAGRHTLTIDDVTVRFGGLVAVQGASLEIPTGRVTGLIGPNGAGKSTTFNAACGLVRLAAGRVLLDGADITGRATAARARAGIGRTFQQTALFDSMSVAENVRLGAEGRFAGRNPLRHLLGSPTQRRTTSDRAHEIIDLCGIAALVDRPVATLSTGQRRLVELARCLAGGPRIALLDEPSAGLDRAETAAFGRVIRRLVDELGVGVLLVEHDMSLVSQACEYIYVLDFGRPITDGPTAEVLRSPQVRAAYLGDDPVPTETTGETDTHTAEGRLNRAPA